MPPMTIHQIVRHMLEHEDAIAWKVFRSGLTYIRFWKVNPDDDMVWLCNWWVGAADHSNWEPSRMFVTREELLAADGIHLKKGVKP